VPVNREHVTVPVIVPMTDVGDPARSFLQVGRAHDVAAVEQASYCAGSKKP